MAIYYVGQDGNTGTELTLGGYRSTESVENWVNWPDTSLDLAKWYPGDERRVADRFIVGNPDITVPLDDAQQELISNVKPVIGQCALLLESILSGENGNVDASELRSTDYEYGLARIGVGAMRRPLYWLPVPTDDDFLQFIVEIDYAGQIFAHVVNKAGVKLDYHAFHLSPEVVVDMHQYLTGVLFPGIFMLDDKRGCSFNSNRGDIAAQKGRAYDRSLAGLLRSIVPDDTEYALDNKYNLPYLLATHALYAVREPNKIYPVLNFLRKFPNVTKEEVKFVIKNGIKSDWESNQFGNIEAKGLYKFVHDMALAGSLVPNIADLDRDQQDWSFYTIVATTKNDAIALIDAVNSLASVGMVLIDRDETGRICCIKQNPNAKWFFDALKEMY